MVTIPDKYEHVANIERMNGAWLLTFHEHWGGSVYDEGGEYPLTTEGYEAWASLAKCKRSLREGFGSLRYDDINPHLIYVYAKLDGRVDR